MTPGLALDSGEFIPVAELNRRIDMTRITDREMQTLRNTGDAPEEAADEILELRERIAELESAVKKLHKAKGRHNSQNAVCDLYVLLGLHTVRTDQNPAPIASGQEPAAQWQKKHPLTTEGKWENTNEPDAKWWRDKAIGWEIRPLYTQRD